MYFTKGAIVVLVLSLLLVVQGLPNGRRPHSLRGKKALDKFIFKRALSKVATVSHVRQTRAVCKTDCDRASSALDLRNAQTCLTTLNKDFGESPDSSVTSTEAKTYCDNHCDTLLVGIFNNITACCGDSGADNILPALQDSCKHNSNGDLCVQDDGLVAKLFTDPSQGMGQSLIECAGAYQGDTSTCPSQCTSDVLSYIANTIGCCYSGVAVVFSGDGGPASLVTSQLFTTCGSTLPSRCTS